VKPELPVQSDGMVIIPKYTEEVYHVPAERPSLGRFQHEEVVQIVTQEVNAMIVS